MGLLGNKEDELSRDYDDRLIIFDDEQNTASIEYVDQVKDGSVRVYGKHTIPIADCKIVNGEVDSAVVRLYFYNAPTESIKVTENLAALEKSIVLKQITDYNEPKPNKDGVDYVKIGLFALLGIAIIFGMGSCGMGV